MEVGKLSKEESKNSMEVANEYYSSKYFKAPSVRNADRKMSELMTS